MSGKPYFPWNHGCSGCPAGRPCNCRPHHNHNGQPPYQSYPSAPAYPSYPGYQPPYPSGAPHYPGSIYPTVPSLDGPSYPAVKHEYPSGHGWIPPSHCTGSHNWVPSHSGHIPPDAVHAGQDQDGGAIYVGRAFHEGDLIPAKVCPNHHCAFISHGGREITKMHYEVLCGSNTAWRYCRDGDFPPEAIRAGTTCDGEPLFVGRTMFQGSLTPGKVHPSHRCLYIPFAGEEMSFPEYEILILN